MQHVKAVCLAGLALGSVSQATAAECSVEKAVYLADSRSKKFSADELRFSFKDSPMAKPWGGFPSYVIIKSAELGRELTFDTYFTNNSAVQGVMTRIADEHLPEHMRQSRAYQREQAEKLEADPDASDDPTLAELVDDGNLKPTTLESMAFVVTKDFKVDHFPTQLDEAPMLVMFPEFRPYAHSSNEGLVSAGIMGGVFRFDRCEGK
jgi:hypothetical protein